jgi:hypothetical protein
VVGVSSVPILLAGSTSPVAVRSLLDFCRWLPALSIPEHGGTGFMAAAAGSVAKLLIAKGDGAEQACYGAMHHLPCDFTGKKQRWCSNGAASLKNGVAPLLPDEINNVINVIKLDLNASFALTLDTSMGTPEPPAANSSYCKWKFVLVGASHAKRLCEVMTGLNMEAVTLGTTSWFPSKKNRDKLADELKEFLEGLEPDPEKKVVVIFANLDKSYFQARSEDGSFIFHRLHDGTYHVDGDLVACPMEQLKFLFELLIPVFNANAGMRRLLLCPIPRYLWKGCCEDPDHAPNRSDEGFQEDILEGLEKAKRVMRSLAFRHDLKDMKIINPGKLLMEPALWGEDPVHPLVDGYKKIIDFVLAGLEAGGSTDTAVLTQPQPSQKRDSTEQLTGPARRPHWVAGGQFASSSQDWATCMSSWPRGRGRGWRGGRGYRRGQ